MRRWEEIFTGIDRNIVRKMSPSRSQFFCHKAALLIIDVTKSFLGSTSESIQRSTAEYVTSCGKSGWLALPNIQKLQKCCRENNIPIIYSIADNLARRFCNGPTKNAFPNLDFNPTGNEIPLLLKPLKSEMVIPKTKASVFFGTPLFSCLRSMEIDSLLIAGCTTSGCVRATVVDGYSYGFSCFVVEDCVFDRFELSHLVNLFDMNAKYADVISLKEAIKLIKKLEKEGGKTHV